MDINREYTILIVPDWETIKRIQDFRLKYIWTDKVDHVPYPHITLKRRFYLKQGFSEQDLIELFTSFVFSGGEIDVQSMQTYSDALVMKGENIKIRKMHNDIVLLVNEKGITKNPEYEWENYGIHLTLFRINDDMNLKEITIDAKNLLGSVKIASVTLAEIGKNRDSYRELYSIKL